jgi:hypothetical protein
MTPQEFVGKWQAVTANERAVAQSNFNDLCALLDVPSPLEADPSGRDYAFEKSVRKAARGKGFADVWKRGAFAWEYKGKGKDLGDAYRQLLLYRDDLDNPPLLVVSDIDRIEVHTNFTGTTKAVHTYRLTDLLDARKRAGLREVWTNPGAFDPRERRERITEDASREIGRIALGLRERGHEPHEVAHFMMQLVFALFAEDANLLPNRLVSKILARSDNPQRVQEYLAALFRAMSEGGEVLLEDVDHFNGGLFDGTPALPLSREEVEILHGAALLDWAEVEPAIFGTLFERSLDPEKRSQLGAHYTSRDDILRIVEPVVMRPLRRRWAEIREKAETYLLEHPDPPINKRQRDKRAAHVDAPITSFLADLHQVRVLDPACGSGNFLYVALQAMKDLEHEAVAFAEQVGAPGLRLLGPKQFHGIEINAFARELASMVAWIGYLQWNRANGISNAQRPILEPLNNIRLHDALLNPDGSEYWWPEAEYIIGNPPFIGDKRMRTELGDVYVDRLRALFRNRLPGQADFVAYWFEKARAQIEHGDASRVGLIATNSIRGGANRRVLERIKERGDIFMAWSDQPWILEGAAVRVSIVGFDDGSEDTRILDGKATKTINADLSGGLDISAAKPLTERLGMGFNGVMPAGPFDLPEDVALSWLHAPNLSGANNGDVLKRYVSGQDIVGRDSRRWIIDFGLMDLEQARQYVVPFAHVEQTVKPVRVRNRQQAMRDRWWEAGRARPAMRRALEPLDRYIATPEVSRHRIFVWLTKDVLPAHKVVVIAADDDQTFGVLNSSFHGAWAKATGSWHGVGNDLRYTYSTTFLTFPFPDQEEEQRVEVEKWAKHLNATRAQLLACDDKLTLTKLYNELEELRGSGDSSPRSYPLLVAHERLDEAVAAAYGWKWPLPDGVILERLLALNLERHSHQ